MKSVVIRDRSHRREGYMKTEAGIEVIQSKKPRHACSPQKLEELRKFSPIAFRGLQPDDTLILFVNFMFLIF